MYEEPTVEEFSDMIVHLSDIEMAYMLGVLTVTAPEQLGYAFREMIQDSWDQINEES